MNKKQAETLLRPELKKLFGHFGFKYHPPLFFSKKHQDHSDILFFLGRTEGAFDAVVFKFSFRVAVKFFAIESILRPEETSPTYPSLAGPMHFLHEDRDILKHEWALGDGDNVDAVIAQVRHEIVHFAQPFFERYATLEAIEEDVRETYQPINIKVNRQFDPWPAKLQETSWFDIDPIQKAELLAAIAILHGRKADALLAIEEIRQNPHFKNSPRLKNLNRIQDQYLTPNASK